MDTPEHGDKAGWCDAGNRFETDFVAAYGERLGLQINPDKAENKYAPDLVDGRGRLADLKTADTVFWSQPGCLTLNAKDMLRYRRHYGDIDLYFWVRWDAPGCGVWKVALNALVSQRAALRLHFYQRRGLPIESNATTARWLQAMEPVRLSAGMGRYWRVMDARGNATCSYVIPLAFPLVQVGLTQGRLF